MLPFLERCLVDGCLVGLGCVSFLKAHLLDVVQSLVWVHENARVAGLLLLSLHLSLEALAEMAVLPELVEQVQVSALLVVIIENGVLAFEATGTGIAREALPAIHGHERERSLSFASISAMLILNLLVLLLLDLILRDEPFLEGVLLALGLADAVGLVIGCLGGGEAALCLRYR